MHCVVTGNENVITDTDFVYTLKHTLKAFLLMYKHKKNNQILIQLIQLLDRDTSDTLGILGLSECALKSGIRK